MPPHAPSCRGALVTGLGGAVCVSLRRGRLVSDLPPFYLKFHFYGSLIPLILKGIVVPAFV